MGFQAKVSQGSGLDDLAGNENQSYSEGTIHAQKSHNSYVSFPRNKHQVHRIVGSAEDQIHAIVVRSNRIAWGLGLGFQASGLEELVRSSSTFGIETGASFAPLSCIVP